jgi:hypothetical protein
MTTNSLNKATSDNNLEQFDQDILHNPMLQEELKRTVFHENLYEITTLLNTKFGYHFTIEQVQAAIAIKAAIEVIELGELNYECWDRNVWQSLQRQDNFKVVNKLLITNNELIAQAENRACKYAEQLMAEHTKEVTVHGYLIYSTTLIGLISISACLAWLL